MSCIIYYLPEARVLKKQTKKTPQPLATNPHSRTLQSPVTWEPDEVVW